MGLQDEKPDGHGAICLVQKFFPAAGKQLIEGDEIAEGFSHFLPVDGEHIVVHPVFHRCTVVARLGLCYFALMVGEQQVHAATVDGTRAG